MSSLPGFTLLHLSDVHFGASEPRGHYWNSESTELELRPHDRRGLLGSLERDLRMQDVRPDVIVITGDILDRGSADGGDMALEFLSALCQRLELPPARVVLVPGNHDVTRADEVSERYQLFDTLWREFYGPERPCFEPGTPPHLRVCRFDFTAELGLEVVGFNSCEALDPGARNEHGSIGTAQRDRAEELLAPSAGRELFRVAAMHHHLVSPAGIVRDDYSVMDDAGLTLEWLAAHRFQLVLHGHQHVDWDELREYDGWAMTIAAAGSTGVASYGRKHWMLQLGYHLIEVQDSGHAQRIRREYDPQRRTWIPAGKGGEVKQLHFGFRASPSGAFPVVLPLRPTPGNTVRRQLVRRVLQHLERRRKMGVALIAPMGFDARDVVDEVMFHLERPDEALVPVRLAPDLSSVTEEALYHKLLRDLHAGLRQRFHGAPAALDERRDFDDAWRARIAERAAAQREIRGMNEPGGEFALALEDACDRLAAEYGRTLLILLDDLAHMDETQRRRWGFLMNRFRDRLKLVVWGGYELYQLIVEPADVGESSAFHQLERVDLLPLSEDEVIDTLAEMLGEQHGVRLGNIVHYITGGHPALVSDVTAIAPNRLLRTERAALPEVLSARLLRGTHMTRLRRELARDDGLQSVLRRFQAHDGPSWAQEWDNPWEERLAWLGIITEAEDGGWCWLAPVMELLAREFV